MNKNSIVYILITCLVFANFFIYSKIITDKIPDATLTPTDGSLISATDETDGVGETDTLPLDSKYIKVNVSDTHSGELMLVNGNFPYIFDNMPTIVEKESSISIYGAKSSSYFVKDINVSLEETAIEAFNIMMDDYYAQNGSKKNIIITQGLRSYEEQQAMLDLKISQLGPDQTIAQKPGYSEHHTGYAFDISTYVNGIMGTFTGEGEYKWVHDNAHKYGFILRYPSGKEDITGISYESWHFRYVGKPHAQYMYRNGLTLEEYISVLVNCRFGESELLITDEFTGETYSVYSVAVANDGTQVPVPTSVDGKEYTISGDNCGNIIVTVKETSHIA